MPQRVVSSAAAAAGATGVWTTEGARRGAARGVTGLPRHAATRKKARQREAETEAERRRQTKRTQQSRRRSEQGGWQKKNMAATVVELATAGMATEAPPRRRTGATRAPWRAGVGEVPAARDRARRDHAATARARRRQRRCQRRAGVPQQQQRGVGGCGPTPPPLPRSHSPCPASPSLLLARPRRRPRCWCWPLWRRASAGHQRRHGRLRAAPPRPASWGGARGRRASAGDPPSLAGVGRGGVTRRGPGGGAAPRHTTQRAGVAGTDVGAAHAPRVRPLGATVPSGSGGLGAWVSCPGPLRARPKRWSTVGRGSKHTPDWTGTRVEGGVHFENEGGV